jgi:hypothetical protein
MTQTVFLLVFIGGFGNTVGRKLWHKLRGTPFEKLVEFRFIDSDRQELANTQAAGVPASQTLDVSLNRGRFEAILYRPQDFGPYFVQFVRQAPPGLNTFTMGTGCATVPALGEFCFRASRYPLTTFLTDGVNAALSKGGQKVVPLLCGSGAGGTSNPGLILTTLLLGSAVGKRETVDADPRQVDPPSWFIMPPRPQARSRANRTFSDRILANGQMIAFEAALLGHHGFLRYVCCPSERNEGGAAADTVETTTGLLADLEETWITCWGTLQQDMCDMWNVRRDDPTLRGLNAEYAAHTPGSRNPFSWEHEFLFTNGQGY